MGARHQDTGRLTVGHNLTSTHCKREHTTPTNTQLSKDKFKKEEEKYMFFCPSM
jgi:hypothetical protein